MQPISVLMSLYQNEKAQFLQEALESIIHQTYPADEIVIVEDGPLSDELYQTLADYEKQYPELIKRYPLKENQGLGLALKYGVTCCQNELIARMDTDDIAVEHRLEWQAKCFENDPELGLNGGHIAEFLHDPQEVISYRKVPLSHEENVSYQKMRSAFNHMTVMYKKSEVLRSGNYEHGMYMEDDLLWANMLQAGVKSSNLDEILCYARVGEGMYERRGGGRYFKYYKQARRKMYDRQQIFLWDYWQSLMVQAIVCYAPGKLRQYIFVHLLRKS